MGNYLKFRPDGTAVGLLALLVAVVLAFSLLMPGRFFSGATFTSVAFQLPELGLLTTAMFIPILSGGLNLCIIASANLTSLLMAAVHQLSAAGRRAGAAGAVAGVGAGGGDAAGRDDWRGDRRVGGLRRRASDSGDAGHHDHG